MSNTYHHGKNLKIETHKNRAPGYEYWSKRPVSNFGGCPPGRYSKTLTHRLERRSINYDV